METVYTTRNSEATIEGYLGNWEDIYGKNPNYTTIGNLFHWNTSPGLWTDRAACGGSDWWIWQTYFGCIRYRLVFMMIMESKFCWRTITGKYWNPFILPLKEPINTWDSVLLTGVTKFSQVSVFSGFNQPKDISMDERYEALCGITQKKSWKHFRRTHHTVGC